jgi:hypothetical protein
MSYSGRRRKRLPGVGIFVLLNVESMLYGLGAPGVGRIDRSVLLKGLQYFIPAFWVAGRNGREIDGLAANFHC